MSDHHDHDHPHATLPDADESLTYYQQLEIAVRELLIERGVFTAEDVHRSLAMAEDLLRGRETLRPKIPENLMLYQANDERDLTEVGFIPSKPSFRTRVEHWLSRHPRLAS